MHVAHVQIVRADGVGNGIRSHCLRLALRVWQHILRVHFNGIITKLGFRHRFQTMRTSREVGVAFDPRERVEVQRKFAAAFARRFTFESNFAVHIHTVLLRSRFDEWEIEVITVVRDVNTRLYFAHVIEPSSQ